MSIISNAQVVYNDLIGSAALDFHGPDSNGLTDFAKSMEIDTDKYDIVGMKLYIGEFSNLSLEFECIELNDENLEFNNIISDITIFERKETLDSFLSRIKRFEIVLRLPFFKFESNKIVCRYNSENTKI